MRVVRQIVCQGLWLKLRIDLLIYVLRILVRYSSLYSWVGNKATVVVVVVVTSTTNRSIERGK